jgi:hypothetical protein
MNMYHLTGKRILCEIRISGYNLTTGIKECHVLEVSPSGEWIKLAEGKGVRSWERTIDVRVIEVLGGGDA